MEADDGGGVREVSSNPNRLVSSVSAYPLPNTNTVSAGIINATPAAAATASAASTFTISSTSSSSSTSTNSSSHSNIQQQLPSGMVNTSCPNTEYTTSGYLHHGSDASSSTSPNTVTSTGDINNAQCNSIGGNNPLDLSGIPPITQVTLPTPTENGEGRFSKSPTPSPKPSPTLMIRQTSCDSSDDRANKNDTCSFISREGSMERSFTEASAEHQPIEKLLDSTSRSSESSRSVEAPRTPEIGTNFNGVLIKERKESRDSKSGDKKSNKAWYKMLNPTYKSRSEDLKRLFKDLPSDERLIVDYSCALQKDILVHGRLYVTPNYFCFYSKIFGWETFQMSATELWQWVHSSYGDELGLTSDDDDYVAPSTEDDTKTSINHGHNDRTCDSSSLNTSLKLYSGDSLEAGGRSPHLDISVLGCQIP
ncbi:Aster-B-like 2 [Homarus americanus]|uniref:Aster-B-like 2 n=1 Tax=Homarus americanus TaxID=6706 RepID=A0A8J5JWM1_HOMAM|nr:Aster-B-like 2 [Homarus americanus]